MTSDERIVEIARRLFQLHVADHLAGKGPSVKSIRGCSAAEVAAAYDKLIEWGLVRKTTDASDPAAGPLYAVVEGAVWPAR